MGTCGLKNSYPSHEIQKQINDVSLLFTSMKTHNSRMSKPTQFVNFILKLLNLLKEIVVVYPIII